MIIFLFFFCQHIYSLRVLAAITTLSHLFLSWTASLQSSTPRVFRCSSITSIHLFLDLPLGLFPCGFESSAILPFLFFSFSHYVTNHYILWPLTKPFTGISNNISHSSLLYLLCQFPVVSLMIDSRIFFYTLFSKVLMFLSVWSSSKLPNH